MVINKNSEASKAKKRSRMTIISRFLPLQALGALLAGVLVFPAFAHVGLERPEAARGKCARIAPATCAALASIR